MAKLIFGCGYLGGRVAERWLAAGHAVAAVTRSDRRAAELRERGLQPIVADVTRPESLAALPEAETVFYAVGFDPRSGRSRREVYVDGLRAVLDALPAATGRIIFISSTGVYSDAAGDWVDEDSPCRPTRDAGRAFLAAEEVLAHHALGDRAIVLRLAGLYGPGRLPHQADILAGKAIMSPANNPINLIHIDDAAATVLAAEARVAPPRTYVVSDGHPVDRRTCFCYLAELLGASMPRFVEPSADFLTQHHSGSNKRVSNARMLGELDVRLSHPTYREGLRASMTKRE